MMSMESIGQGHEIVLLEEDCTQSLITLHGNIEMCLSIIGIAELS